MTDEAKKPMTDGKRYWKEVKDGKRYPARDPLKRKGNKVGNRRGGRVMAEKKQADSWDYAFHGVEETELLINTSQVSGIVGLSRTTLEHMRLKGGGPPFTKEGRSVRYKLSDVYQWIDSKKSFSSTSDVAVNSVLK